MPSLNAAALGGLAAFGIHELRKQTAEEFPDAGYNEFFGRTRERVVGAVKDANISERTATAMLYAPLSPPSHDPPTAARV